MTLFEELSWRGIVKDYTQDTEKHIEKEGVHAYIGFDPTADSLHVGSLLPIMCLARFQKFGHTPIVLVGGGTGMIGDPSGKTVERQLLTLEKIQENAKSLHKQLAHFLDFDSKTNPALMVNNADWLVSISLMTFLRDVGKYFTTNYMRSKESVKRREETGLSYTEFSYMLLQAYDFYELLERENCTLQMGGSDQWGNIVAGIDLIGKKTEKQAYGMTFPLVTSASGVKFGKTEAGTIWLDGQKTSPYKFYQFWLRTSEQDVIQYLKYFTWLTQSEISALENENKNAPEKRVSQRILAEKVTEIVHGKEALSRAIAASSVLFGGGNLADFSIAEIKDIFEDVPSYTLSKEKLTKGISISSLLTENKIFNSKSEVRRMIENGGLSLNSKKMNSSEELVEAKNSLQNQFFVVRKGKKDYFLFQIID